MPEKILIVDDDKNICEILEFNLKNEGFDIEIAFSAEEALKKLSTQFSLILLDIMMSGISGYKMAEKLRTEGNQTPDYISKPFSIKEVIARIKAVLKRKNNLSTENKLGHKLIFDYFIIDLETKELTIKALYLV